MKKPSTFFRALFSAAIFTLASFAHAAYPDRPITLIVPWGAGGGTDGTARIIAALMEKELGQPINVVNRTGGSGVVGHDRLVDSAFGRTCPHLFTAGINICAA